MSETAINETILESVEPITAVAAETTKQNFINPEWRDDALYNFVSANQDVLVNVDGQVITISAAMNAHNGPWTAENEPNLLAYAQYLVANRLNETEEEEKEKTAEEEPQAESEENNVTQETNEKVTPDEKAPAVEQPVETQTNAQTNPVETQTITVGQAETAPVDNFYEIESEIEQTVSLQQAGPQNLEALTVNQTNIRTLSGSENPNPKEAKSNITPTTLEKTLNQTTPDNLEFKNQPIASIQELETIEPEQTPTYEIPDMVEHFDIVGETTTIYDDVLSFGEDAPDGLSTDAELIEPAEFIEGELVLIDHTSQLDLEFIDHPVEFDINEPILIFENSESEQGLTEPQRVEVNQTFAQLVEVVTVEESKAIETAQETIVGIINIVASYEKNDLEMSEDEALAELEELFVELFESLQIEYSEEMPKTFARLALHGNLLDQLEKLLSQDQIELLLGKGTNEAIPQILIGTDPSQNFVAQVYALGRSALQLADLALAA